MGDNSNSNTNINTNINTKLLCSTYKNKHNTIQCPNKRKHNLLFCGKHKNISDVIFNINETKNGNENGNENNIKVI